MGIAEMTWMEGYCIGWGARNENNTLNQAIDILHMHGKREQRIEDGVVLGWEDRDIELTLEMS